MSCQLVPIKRIAIEVQLNRLLPETVRHLDTSVDRTTLSDCFNVNTSAEVLRMKTCSWRQVAGS